MSITLSPETSGRVEAVLASGGYGTPDELVDEALRFYLLRQEDDPGIAAMQRLGDMVEAAGLYDQVYVGVDEG